MHAQEGAYGLNRGAQHARDATAVGALCLSPRTRMRLRTAASYYPPPHPKNEQCRDLARSNGAAEQDRRWGARCTGAQRRAMPRSPAPTERWLRCSTAAGERRERWARSGQGRRPHGPLPPASLPMATGFALGSGFDGPHLIRIISAHIRINQCSYSNNQCTYSASPHPYSDYSAPLFGLISTLIREIITLIRINQHPYSRNHHPYSD
jgi:hypothetical protein